MHVITCLITVGVMLLYALPGFLLIKSKLVRREHIPAFAAMLLYVCQPCLAVYSLQKVDYTPQLLRNMGILFALTVVLQVAMLLGGYTLLGGKRADINRRVAILCSGFGNTAFMGTPLVEALLPQHPEAVLYTTVFYLSMSLLGWTLGCAILTSKSSYIRIRRFLLNPALLALCAALPLFFFHIKLPAQLLDMVTLLGRMTTPLCMLMIGMRLAEARPRTLFGDKMLYVGSAAKLLAMPLVALLLNLVLPLDAGIEQTLYLLCCCPVAAIVQNFAELLGEGQQPAAYAVVLSTLLSLVTIPLMMLLL